MAIATTSMTTSTFSFNDIFHELNDELEIEANDWHLNNFYINFEDEIQDDVKNINKVDGDHRFFHAIPDYLSASNRSFRATFFSELRSIYNPIDFQDLQQLNMLTHQMSIIHLHQQLWHRFLQSGTGQLKQREQPSSRQNVDITHSFWPEIVTSAMISKGIINDANRQDEIDQKLYINFIQNYLHQLEKKVKQCRFQFDTIKNRLPGYADALDDKIEHFIQNEGLMAMRLHFQTRIALIQYICVDRSYQLKYFQQKPTHLQLEVAKDVCSLTFNKEKAEQELILYKFGNLYKKLPKSLDQLEVSPPTLITTISDPAICKRLSNQYQTIIQRAKADLMHVLTNAAEVKKNDYQKKFDKGIPEIWKNQRQLLIHERLTTTMLEIIEDRQKNIIECVKCIYELKGNFFLNVPTTTVIS